MSNEQLKKDVQARLDVSWFEFNSLVNEFVAEQDDQKLAKTLRIGGEISALTWVLEQIK